MRVRRVGFTGTRDGMSVPQRTAVGAILDGLFDDFSADLPAWAHHGDCIGADVDFHKLAAARGLRIMIHPPDNPKLRAYLIGDDIAPEKPYLVRDRDIANAADILIATPQGFTDNGGGTWYTANYAWGRGKAVVIVRPDGSITANEALWRCVTVCPEGSFR